MNFNQASIKITDNNKTQSSKTTKKSLQLEWDYENPCVRLIY